MGIPSLDRIFSAASIPSIFPSNLISIITRSGFISSETLMASSPEETMAGTS